MNAPGKAKKIVRRSSRLDKIETNSELTALVLEAELVKKYNPPMNSQLKKYSQNYFIHMNNEKKYPVPKVTSQFDFDGTDYFGPYNRGEIARSIVDIIHRTFSLRECTEKEFLKNRKCYLADIERCLAPCIFDVPEKYSEELNKAYEFLSGKNQHAIDRLLKKMKDFSEAKKYEEAAFLRDTVNMILNQLNKSSILAEPVNKANVLIKIKTRELIDYLLMIEGKVYIKNYPVDNEYNFKEAIEDYFSGTVKNEDHLTMQDLERMKISLSWMVKNRTMIELHYLKDYSSQTELWSNMSSE
jgi:excinuclease UvrABC nuclease subunit